MKEALSKVFMQSKDFKIVIEREEHHTSVFEDSISNLVWNINYWIEKGVEVAHYS